MSFLSKERRGGDRRPPRAGKATVLVGTRKIECLCENVSPGGAGLKLAADILLPPTFSLSLEGRARSVQMVW